jgi:hypothetical protein
VHFAGTIEQLETLTDEVAKEADLAEKEEASKARSKAEARAECETFFYISLFQQRSSVAACVKNFFSIHQLRLTNVIPDEQHRSLFDWLHPVDSSTNYNKAVSLHEDGTGEWIFENEQFKDWFRTDGSAIWLHAKRVYLSTLIPAIPYFSAMC